MKNKKLLIFIAVMLIIGSVTFFIFNQNRSEQKVLESTYDISKEYLSLRYRTDNILVNAKEYDDYSTWDQDMTQLIKDWENIEKRSRDLENSAAKTAEIASLNFQMVKTVRAYTAKEISNIYDKAPKFKGIATLASHLGVDAKRAQVILDQAQAQINSEVFSEEGDSFETLENTAIVVKDGCKVVGFVGGVVLTGGVGALATAGTVAQVGTVVVGVDLALEVTEDGAQIAFGDRNKVSSFVKGVRTVTEPVANVFTITDIPRNFGTAYGKFDSVMIGLEQFRDSAQEGKVIGVDLRNFEYQKPFQRIRQAKYPGTVTVAEMEMAEVEEWLKSLNKEYKPMTVKEVEEFLAKEPKEIEQEIKAATETNQESSNLTGKSDTDSENNKLNNTAWKGTVESVSGGNEEKQSIEFEFVLKEGGTVEGNNFKKWKQEGDRIKLFGEDESLGYYEFKVGDNDLLLTKMLIGDELIQPGERYMGGIAPWGFLYRKSGLVGDDSQSAGGAMPISEFNEMSDDGLFNNIASVTEELGEPDVETTDDNGRIIYIYYDLVKYDSGNLGSVKMAFYNEEGYKSYIEGAGASWDSNKENWDESGGGIRAYEEIRPKDTYKSIYGE